MPLRHPKASAIDSAPLSHREYRRGEARCGRTGAGFTIIELVVVLAVIAILASVTVALFSSARARGRDVRREQDIKTLQSAFSLYVTNIQTYPLTDAAGVYLTGSDAVSVTLLSTGVIAAIPQDPRNSDPFRYRYTSADGSTYTLIYSLETGTIPGKTVGGQQAGP